MWLATWAARSRVRRITELAPPLWINLHPNAWVLSLRWYINLFLQTSLWETITVRIGLLSSLVIECCIDLPWFLSFCVSLPSCFDPWTVFSFMIVLLPALTIAWLSGLLFCLAIAIIVCSCWPCLFDHHQWHQCPNPLLENGEQQELLWLPNTCSTPTLCHEESLDPDVVLSTFLRLKPDSDGNCFS